MKNFSVLVITSLLLGALGGTLKTEVKKDNSWTYLILAQFWPPTSCKYFGDSGCIIPKEVHGWTIHGLWPSNPGTELPQYCNDSMKFKLDEIESLRNQLDVMWPYYNKSGVRSELWAHEWDKHGTCAYTLLDLRGELKYFSRTLALYKTLNVYHALAGSGILPSTTKQVLPEDVFDAVHEAYGKIPNIACFYDKKEHEPYLEQVWLCYNKNFDLIDCPEVSEPVVAKRNRQRTGGSLTFHSQYPGAADIPLKLGSFYLDCEQNKPVWYKPIPSHSVNVPQDRTYKTVFSESYEIEYERFTFVKKN